MTAVLCNNRTEYLRWLEQHGGECRCRSVFVDREDRLRGLMVDRTIVLPGFYMLSLEVAAERVYWASVYMRNGYRMEREYLAEAA